MADTAEGAVKLVLKKIRLPLAGFVLELDLELAGRVTALFGPSGSGKTSLLDLIAGLRRPESAWIELDGRVLTDTAAGVAVPPRLRRIGYLPQDLALFPHLSVHQNVLYGRKAENRGSELFTLERIAEVLEIEPLLDRSIGELSGGEQQRVALARALLSSPSLLLLDEPLASLDAQLKSRILPYFLRIRHEFDLPLLYVTHDRFETLALADEMIVLVNGKVAQVGPVQEVFSRPANLAVAGLSAVETVQPGRIQKVEGGLASVAVGQVRLTAVLPELPAGTTDVHVCIRAEDVILLRDASVSSSARNQVSATIRTLTNSGPLVRIELECGFPLSALLTRQACEELALQPGEQVTVLVKAPHVHLIPR